MKVHIEYTRAECRNPRSAYWRGECPYIFDPCQTERCCDYFERVDYEGDPCSEEELLKEDDCRHMWLTDIVEAKERKTLEVVKDCNEGYVSFGRKEIPLRSVDLLRLDYGDGWKTEWKADEE